MESRVGIDHFKIFDNSGKTIFKKRNEVKIIGDDAYKRFKPPHLLNRIIYTFFRKSKAERSFLNAKELIKRGVSTPEPKAFFEKKRGLFLYDSLYISSYIRDYFEIRDVFNLKVSNRDEILKDFGRFIAELHKKSILHTDFSPGNTIITIEDSQYKFHLIDINRMIFKSLSRRERIKNFSKLSTSDLDLSIIIGVYSKLMGDDYQLFLNSVLKERRREKSFLKRKRVLKRWLKK